MHKKCKLQEIFYSIIWVKKRFAPYNKFVLVVAPVSHDPFDYNFQVIDNKSNTFYKRGIVELLIPTNELEFNKKYSYFVC